MKTKAQIFDNRATGQFSSKRTIRLANILFPIGADLLVYPRGLVSSLRASKDETSSVKRVEIFAKEKTDSFGILRRLPVAYTAERQLLRLAEMSDSVIQVRAYSSPTGSRDGRSDKIDDRMILKRFDGDEATEREQKSYSLKIPRLHVPVEWLEKFDLHEGETINVSNPRERYLVPPPSLP